MESGRGKETRPELVVRLAEKAIRGTRTRANKHCGIPAVGHHGGYSVFGGGVLRGVVPVTQDAKKAKVMKSPLSSDGEMLRQLLAERGMEFTPDEVAESWVEAVERNTPPPDGRCVFCGKKTNDLRCGGCFDCVVGKAER